MSESRQSATLLSGVMCRFLCFPKTPQIVIGTVPVARPLDQHRRLGRQRCDAVFRHLPGTWASIGIPRGKSGLAKAIILKNLPRLSKCTVKGHETPPLR